MTRVEHRVDTSQNALILRWRPLDILCDYHTLLMLATVDCGAWTRSLGFLASLRVINPEQHFLASPRTFRQPERQHVPISSSRQHFRKENIFSARGRGSVEHAESYDAR
jgi:hypothetical protein